MARKKDLTGLKFGRLTVLYEVEPTYTSGGHKKITWHCICDCGKELNVRGEHLKSGSIQSCRCLNDEKRHMSKNKKYNSYDLTGNYGIGYDSKGNEFWFDLEDYDLIKDYCWYKHHEYFEANDTSVKPKKHIALHKLIMNDLENKYDIDHIKTESKFDNRKSNLRIATRSQNNTNKDIMNCNTSGATGVRWHSRDCIWEAWVNVDKKHKYLGRYKNFDDAVKARKDAEKIYYGDFSYDKSQEIAKQNSAYD